MAFRLTPLVLGVGMAALGLRWCLSLTPPPPAGCATCGRIVVANRGSGSITAIDPDVDRPLGTYDLPAGKNPPEAMYVVDAGDRRVLVGDRANDRLVLFEADTFSVLKTVPAGRGVFHMSAGRRQLWITNDLDNTSTVLDVRTLAPVAVVPMPADLVALGGRPHDVAVDAHDGRHAYVTIAAVPGPSDFVVRFRTDTFQEAARAAVGKDPHVAVDGRGGRLFVTCQGTSGLHVLDARAMTPLDELSIPGAHAAVLSPDGGPFYTTNLPGGGVEAIFVVDPETRRLAGRPADTPFAMPHNVTVTADRRKLYLTHSGARSNAVSVFRLDARGVPAARVATVEVGLNPYGIAFVR